MEDRELLVREAYDEGVVTEVIRPAAIVPAQAARAILVELSIRDAQTGGFWRADPTTWSRYDKAWDGPGTPGDAQLLGTIQVVYGTPTRYEITIHRVTVTALGAEQGVTVESLCEEALRFGGLSLASCPRARLQPPPKPFSMRLATAVLPEDEASLLASPPRTSRPAVRRAEPGVHLRDAAPKPQVLPAERGDLPATGRGRRRRVRPETEASGGDLAYFELGVADTRRAQEFFGNVLGWRFAGGISADGYHVQTPDGPPGGLRGEEISPGMRVFIRVPDLDLTTARIRELGGSVDAVEDGPGGRRAHCRDDQGTRFSLVEPPRHR